jgi:GT2 family glycosyltransferase
MVTIEILEVRYASAENSEFPRFHLDNPREGKQYRPASIEVAGWILAGSGPVVVEVRLNGRLVDQLPVNQPRPDVAADYPDHPNATLSGFAAHINLEGPEHDVQVHLAALLENNQSVDLATLVARRRAATAYFSILTASRAAACRSVGKAIATTPRRSSSNAISDPLCSVVIPIHNQAGLTRQCLDALLIAIDNDPSVEIIVVDDASTDDTPGLLASYDDRLRVITLDLNRGFAGACNAGAETARGQLLVFLNNDTVPTQGWLTALIRYADAHPAAGVIGSKLLFPDDTVQHAGITVGFNGLPHHIYAGFPKDHPAVNVSRQFQAVTAACCLVRRRAWDYAGGFDTSFINGWEDVDLCLRLGAAGLEIHYCHESVVYHLDKATRGPDSPGEQHNRELFQQRWGDRVERDSIHYYSNDGLFSMFDTALYPLVARGSQDLVVVPEKSDDAIQRVLDQYAEQVTTLRVLVSTLEAQLAKSRQSDVGSTLNSSRDPSPTDRLTEH